MGQTNYASVVGIKMAIWLASAIEVQVRPPTIVTDQFSDEGGRQNHPGDPPCMLEFAFWRRQLKESTRHTLQAMMRHCRIHTAVYESNWTTQQPAQKHGERHSNNLLLLLAHVVANHWDHAIICQQKSDHATSTQQSKQTINLTMTVSNDGYFNREKRRHIFDKTGLVGDKPRSHDNHKFQDFKGSMPFPMK